MNLTYQTEEMREACHDLQVATRRYGKQIARKLHKKIALLNAASNLAQLMSFDNNAHWLEANRHWQFSIPLAQGHSLLLTSPDRATRAPQELEAMEVIKVEDYHR